MNLIKLLLLVSFLTGCASLQLNSLEEIPRESYNAQNIDLQKTFKTSMQTRGNALQIPDTAITRGPFLVNVLFQNKLPSSVDTLAEYITAWGARGGSIYGFRGSANLANDKLAAYLKGNGFEKVYRHHKSYNEYATKNPKDIKVPVAMPDPGFTRKDVRHHGVVTAYNGVAFDTINAKKVASIDGGANFFPYINISLRKTGATLTKTGGERVINYQAAINGYFLLCDKSVCTDAFVNNSSLKFTMPMLNGKKVSKDTWAEVDSYTQDLLGTIMAGMASTALDEILIK